MTDNQKLRVAIACQGGGSHTAFTAGALKAILSHYGGFFEIVAFSGTSGGAICALLAWYGLLNNDPAKGIELLDNFWCENAATSPWEWYLNQNILCYSRLHSLIPLPEVSPYLYPDWAQHRLQRLLENQVPFSNLDALIQPDSPALLVGAVDVLSGAATVFDSRKQEISVAAILASAAIPTLFRAVRVGPALYWDGMFSQNPPVRELAQLHPDELWVIQINPSKRTDEPRTTEEIRDRRNELAGDLSLEQELHFIQKVNEWLEHKLLVDSRYAPIQVRKIMLMRDLDYASKLDRNPTFIQSLMTLGRDQATEFLNSIPFAEVYQKSNRTTASRDNEITRKS